MPTLVVFAYYSDLVLTKSHNNLLFRVAVTEHSVFCLMYFTAFTLHGEIVPPGTTFAVYKVLVGVEFFFHCSKVLWCLSKMFDVLKLSVVVRLIFVGHTWNSILL